MADANQPLGGTAIKPVIIKCYEISPKIYIFLDIYNISISGWLGPDWMGGFQIHAF